MPGGRPKQNVDENLPEGWKESILELLCNGASLVEVKAWIYKQKGTFSNDLWNRWMEEEPEFSQTIKMGKVLSEAWWKEQGRINMKDKEFSYTGWYMNMKNRFGWADKRDHKHSADPKNPLSINVNIQGSKSQLLDSE